MNIKQQECHNCGCQASVQRIKIVDNRFCSSKCLVEFADKYSPTWKDSMYHEICREEVLESKIND